MPFILCCFGECFIDLMKSSSSIFFFILMELPFKNYDGEEVQVNRSGIIVGCAIAGLSVFLLIIFVLLSAKKYSSKAGNESHCIEKRERTSVRLSHLSQSPSEPQRGIDTLSELPSSDTPLSKSNLLLRSVSRLPSILLKSASLFSITSSKSMSIVTEVKEQENKRYSMLKAFYLHPAEVPNWIASSPLIRSPQSLFESLRSSSHNQATDNNRDHAAHVV